MHISRQDWFWFLLILSVALGLRLYALNAPLWYDEILTVDTHLRRPWNAMLSDYSMNHHYFYSLLAKLSAALFGEAAWSFRLPAVLFGVGTVAALWVLARDVAGARLAYLTALLAALSYHQVWFSQNARGYTELAFFSILGLILFLCALAKPRLSLWVGFGLCLAASVFTHLTGAFFFAALGLVWVGWVTKKMTSGQLRNGDLSGPVVGALLGLALIALLYLPLFPSMVEVLGGVSDSSAVDVMKEYQNPLWTLIEGVRTATGQGTAISVLVLMAIAALLVAALTVSTVRLVVLVLGLHVALTLVLLNVLGMRIWPRFFFVDIGLALIPLVVGTAVWARWLGLAVRQIVPERTWFFIAASTMVALSLVLVLRNYAAPKQNLIGALTRAEAEQADRVFIVGPGAAAYHGYFQRDWPKIDNSADFEAALALSGSSVFVVPFPGRMLRTIPELAHAMGGELQEIAVLPGTLGDGRVLVLRHD